MIWNGTDPLEPDHEVAYRGWPTERVTIEAIGSETVFAKGKDGCFAHNLDGTFSRFFRNHRRDLIPLQQQEPAK